MTKRIIYQNEEGGICVVVPCNPNRTVEELARKDVPAGQPFKIINTSDVPSDRTFREAWEADFTNPDGYGIGHEAWFAEQATEEQA
jgi:hypothetical protein